MAFAYPSLWADNVRSLHTSLALGIEGIIKDGIASDFSISFRIINLS